MKHANNIWWLISIAFNCAVLIKITEIYTLGLSDTNFINNIDTKNTRVILKKIIDIHSTQVL